MTTFRKGDLVSVTFEVDWADDAELQLIQENHYSRVYVPAASATMVKPLIEVGDWVEWHDIEPRFGRVLSVNEGCLWVYHPRRGHDTVSVVSVKRMDPVEATAVSEPEAA